MSAAAAVAVDGVERLRCRVADHPWSRARGLLGARGLPRGEGLWLQPAASIHMFFMRFAIDAVFVDRHGVVRKVAAGLRPWRVAGCRGARSVLELAAGEAGRAGIRVGSTLVLTRGDAR
jgi:uncharacterized membrane protein (UPF0127 family)